MKVYNRLYAIFLICWLSSYASSLNAQKALFNITIEPVKTSYHVQDTVWVNYSWPNDSLLGNISWNGGENTSFNWIQEDTITTRRQGFELKQLRVCLVLTEVGKLSLPDLIRTNDSTQLLWKGVQQLEIQPKKSSHRYDNLFQNAGGSGQSQKTPIATSELFMIIELSKPIVFIGEEAVVCYYVLSSAPFTPNNLFIDEIRLAYTWEDENNTDEKLREATVKIGGRKYFKNLIKRMHLFPQTTGIMEVGKGHIEGIANIPLRDNSLDAQLARMSGQQLMDTQQVQITCPSKILEVTGSDQLNNGNDFLTGNYVLSVSSSDSVLNLQSPILYKIRIEGFGNLKYKHPAVFSDSSNWEIDIPVEKDSFYVKEGRIYGYREYQYTLTPKKAGSINLPLVRVANLSTISRKLEWLQAAGKQILIVDPDAKRKLMAKKEEEDRERFWKRVVYIAAALLVSIFLFWQIRKYYINKYIAPIARRKEEIRLAKLPMNQLLADLDSQITTNKQDNSLVEDRVYKIIVHYLKDRFHINENFMNEKNIMEAMKRKGCAEESIGEFNALYNSLLERNFGIRKEGETIEGIALRIKEIVVNLEGPLSN